MLLGLSRRLTRRLNKVLLYLLLLPDLSERTSIVAPNSLRKTLTCSLLLFISRKFSRTGAIFWNRIPPDWRDLSKPIFREKIRRFLFETLSDRDDYVEVDTLTQVLKFSS